MVAISRHTRRLGVGRALVKRCVDQARERGCRRVWLITANNNTTAIAFYQRIVMDPCAYYRHSVRASRLLKTYIAQHDSARVRIDHQLEFKLLLDPELAKSTT